MGSDLNRPIIELHLRRKMEDPHTITQEQFDHLPSDLHRLVVRELIRRGEWFLIVDSVANKSLFGGDNDDI